MCDERIVLTFYHGIPLIRKGNMLRRIISCLLLGAFCCTLAACGSKPEAPVQKDSKSNPVDAAKQSGSQPFKPEAIE